MRAAIGEHSTGLGICVIVAVPDASQHLPPTSPAASTSLNSHLFVLYIFGGQLSPVVISVHGIEQIGNPHDNHRNG